MMDAGFARQRGGSNDKWVLTIALGILGGYIGALALTYSLHIWILDGRGHPVMQDFVAFWTAGRQTLSGHALNAYDPHLEHVAEVATTGQPFKGTLGWSYPPAFLFVAAALALMPYAMAFLVWAGTTLVGYGLVVARIARRASAFPVACSAPWVLLGLMPGQNGFLTAALAGAGLLCLEANPAAAGLLFGLLSYKPQFGILVPLALAAGGHWRCIGWAIVSAVAVNLLAADVFGLETFAAFFHALTGASQSHLAHAGVGWNKLQSLYGLLRSIGVGGNVAAAGQALFTLALAAGIVSYWRGDAPLLLKAAALSAAIPLATPYVFVYDLPLLSVTCAFLFRHRPFDRYELSILALTVPCMFGFLWVPVPTAFFAVGAVAALTMRRMAVGREEGACQEPALQAAQAAPWTALPE